MKRVKLIVAYDGTNYCGWQVQPNAVTVEGVINEKLSELLKEEITVIGASRTDSGVHAMGNVCVFDTESRMPAEKISYALNQRLPEDIRIQDSVEVDAEFHPRYQDCRKTYRYRVVASEFPNPIKRLYAHFVYRTLDLGKIREAANYLVGTHDFKSFCSANTQVKETVRTIYRVDVTQVDDEIIFEINGNGFLYNMVRIIAGTLLQVGMGAIKPEEIPGILEAKDRTKAGPTAPAKGLMLVEIKYLGSEKH
ncbi:MAG: tRNA pseudouridine(38-40) synthase TruA [bacterium]|nr:tRNA pseudouridine(38-40) synthase TruA [bacterium]